MGKRYLFFFALFFAGGLAYAAAFGLGRGGMLLLAGVLAALLGLGVLLRRLPVSLAAASGLALGLAFFAGYTQLLVAPLQQLENAAREVSAVVCAYPDQYEDSQRVEIRVDASASGIDYPLPDYVFEVTPADSVPLRYLPLALAERWKENILSALDAREGGFLISLLLGDRSKMSTADYQNLKKAGLSHIVAVSGMHLMFLVAFLTQIFGKRWGTILSVPVVLFFACMAGNSPSVMRAGIMTIAAAASFLLMDETDSLTILAFSLMVLLLHNPYSIGSTSLQLSYLSTLGLLLYAGRVRGFLDRPFSGLPKPLRKRISALTAAVSCSFCSLLFTTPVLLLTFGYVTLLSPLSNLLTLGVVSLLFLLGFLFSVLSMATGCLTPLFVPALTVLVRYILFVCEGCAGLWAGVVYWDSIYAKIAIVVACLLSAAIIFHKYSRPKFTLPLLCVILVVTVFQNARTVQNTTTITVHPVGNGQMITVAAGRDTLSVIDCGCSSTRDAAETLGEYMLWNGFESVDTLVLTAVDKSHARSLETLLLTYPIGRIVLPDHLQENAFTGSMLEAMEASGVPYEQWTAAGESAYPMEGVACSLIGGTDRKLGVRLKLDDGDFLTMHSFTQKMMDELLRTTLMQSDFLVLSPGNLEKPKLLKYALETMKPELIVFPAGADTVASKLYGIPTRSTYLEGEITFQTTRIME